MPKSTEAIIEVKKAKYRYSPCLNWPDSECQVSYWGLQDLILNGTVKKDGE